MINFSSPSCHPGAHACGGHADRWYGIFVVFWLAVLTNRRLLLDIPAPVDLDTFLVPNEIDWRVTDELRKVRSMMVSESESLQIKPSKESSLNE